MEDIIGFSVDELISILDSSMEEDKSVMNSSLMDDACMDFEFGKLTLRVESNGFKLQGIAMNHEVFSSLLYVIDNKQGSTKHIGCEIFVKSVGNTIFIFKKGHMVYMDRSDISTFKGLVEYLIEDRGVMIKKGPHMHDSQKEFIDCEICNPWGHDGLLVELSSLLTIL